MPLYSVLCTGFVDTVLICAIHRTLTEKKKETTTKKKRRECYRGPGTWERDFHSAGSGTRGFGGLGSRQGYLGFVHKMSPDGKK